MRVVASTGGRFRIRGTGSNASAQADGLNIFVIGSMSAGRARKSSLERMPAEGRFNRCLANSAGFSSAHTGVRCLEKKLKRAKLPQNTKGRPSAARSQPPAPAAAA